jgi:hypothetical protein
MILMTPSTDGSDYGKETFAGRQEQQSHVFSTRGTMEDVASLTPFIDGERPLTMLTSDKTLHFRQQK